MLPADRRRAIATSTSALLLAGGTLVCCALPIALVALGLGSAVAALTSSAPWLVTLSYYKAWMFALSAVVLAIAGWLLYRPGRACPPTPHWPRPVHAPIVGRG